MESQCDLVLLESFYEFCAAEDYWKVTEMKGFSDLQELSIGAFNKAFNIAFNT